MSKTPTPVFCDQCGKTFYRLEDATMHRVNVIREYPGTTLPEKLGFRMTSAGKWRSKYVDDMIEEDKQKRARREALPW